MSILFPKVRMPRAYDYRPIYYDPKEDERKQKLARLQAKRRQEEAKKAAESGEQSAEGEEKPLYVSTLHRGSFREAHDEHKSYRQKEQRKSRLIFWIALLGILFVVFYMWM